jgi:hypothetical protein
MGNIVGNNPKKWASNQVKVREQQLGLQNKTPEALAWSTNNTAWIRAISAVQVSEDKSKELTGSPNYTGGELAKEFMLFSGTSALNENIYEDPETSKKEITYTAIQKSGVLNTSWSALNNINSSAYGFVGSAERGLVPMPGIVSLDINTYNRGSLRNASLKIKAYNREQFAILDALFMRPGYSLLIEWGHTIYFKGTPENPTYQLADFNTKAFQELNNFLDNKGDVKEGSATILKSIAADRGNGSFKEEDAGDVINGTQGNYDGFYGKITNFVWGLNNDGSYDIEVKAISIGDVIESLTINNVAEPNTDQATPTPKATTTVKNKPTHIIYIKDAQGKQVSVPVTEGTQDQYKEYWDDPANYTQAGYEAAKKKHIALDRFNTNTLKPPPNLLAPEKGLEDDVLISSKDKTILNRWLFDQYNYLKTNIGKIGSDIKTTTGSSTSIRTLNTYSPTPGDWEGLIMVQPKTTRDVQSGSDGSVVNQVTRLAQNAPYQYVRLRNLLLFIQDKLLMHTADENNTKPEAYVKFDLDDDNYMYTQPGQLSADPNVCVIPFIFPKAPSGKTIDDLNVLQKKTLAESKDLSPIQLEALLKSSNTFPNLILEDTVTTYWGDVLTGVNFNVKNSDYVAKLLEIPINIHYVAQTLKQSTSNNAVKLLPFLESLMYGIQEALGSLNQFSVTYDHDSNEIVIRDDVPLDPRIATETVKLKDDRTFFNVTGYKPLEKNSSFITNVGVSTTLSNAFATMISIGAQSQSHSDISNATSLSKFNVGLRDSVAPSKISKAVAGKEKDASKDPVVIFNKTLVSLNKSDSLLSYFYKNGNLPSGELLSSSRSQISAFNRYVSTINLYQQGGKEIPSSQGFIPFNMNLDMMGFSGLRIYEKFYISSEILPKSYPDTMSFLVKGLSHSVDSSGWKTKIDSLTVTNVDNLKPNPNPAPPPNFNVTQDPEVIANADTSPGALTDLRLNGTGARARALVETFLTRPMTDEEWDNLVAATAAEASSDSKERALVMKVIATRARFRKTSIITVLTAPNQFQAVTGRRGSRGPGKNFKTATQRTANQIFEAVEEFFLNGKSFYCFTSNKPKAYGIGTNVNRIKTEGATPGAQVVGDTLFSRPKFNN